LAARQVPKGPVALVQVDDHYEGSERSYLSRLYEDADNRTAALKHLVNYRELSESG
jgi:hypothetical protein